MADVTRDALLKVRRELVQQYRRDVHAEMLRMIGIHETARAMSDDELAVHLGAGVHQGGIEAIVSGLALNPAVLRNQVKALNEALSEAQGPWKPKAEG